MREVHTSALNTAPADIRVCIGEALATLDKSAAEFTPPVPDLIQDCAECGGIRFADYSQAPAFRQLDNLCRCPLKLPSGADVAEVQCLASQTSYGLCNDCRQPLTKDDGFTHCAACRDAADRLHNQRCIEDDAKMLESIADDIDAKERAAELYCPSSIPASLRGIANYLRAKGPARSSSPVLAIETSASDGVQGDGEPRCASCGARGVGLVLHPNGSIVCIDPHGCLRRKAHSERLDWLGEQVERGDFFAVEGSLPPQLPDAPLRAAPHASGGHPHA